MKRTTLTLKNLKDCGDKQLLVTILGIVMLLAAELNKADEIEELLKKMGFDYEVTK